MSTAASPPASEGVAIVVMGVSGSGKTTVGSRLAQALGAEFIDGDDLHTEAARAKMGAGHALTDERKASASLPRATGSSNRNFPSCTMKLDVRVNAESPVCNGSTEGMICSALLCTVLT